MRIPDQETIDRLLAVIPERSPFGLRDHAMIRLALYTGLRVAELTGLTIQDLYTDTPRKMLDLPYQIAKGRRSRRINLSEKAQTAIQDLVDFLHLRGLNTQPDAQSSKIAATKSCRPAKSNAPFKNTEKSPTSI
jgi:site-specific recombinase XerC